jgi:hypothetical protein
VTPSKSHLLPPTGPAFLDEETSMRTLRATLTAGALTVAVAGLSGCGTSSTPAAPTSAARYGAPSTAASTTPAAGASSAPTATGSLTASDQTSNGKSVVIQAVDIQGGKGGWIALHADLNGKPGPVQYEVAVPAGASTNVNLPTAAGIPTGRYWPMLHVDDHAIGTYEFPTVPGADLPAMANGAIVMKMINVTVQ